MADNDLDFTFDTKVDLQEDLEDEQFKEEQDDGKLNKEVYKKLKEEKRIAKILKKNSPEVKQKHKPTFTRKDNRNCYVCDSCGKIHAEEDGSRITKGGEGEYAYCDECLKVLYPKYRKVYLAVSQSKTDYLDNHCDLKYSKGF